MDTDADLASSKVDINVIRPELLNYLSSSDQSQQRPYLGVRVKDPVKELLKRKRKNVENTNTTSGSSVILPHLSMTCYSQIGYPAFHEADAASPPVQPAEEGTFHTTWLPQPSSASLQPVSQWSPCPSYPPHDAVDSPFMQDMCMPAACPSYTMLGPPSAMPYSSQPLQGNFTGNCQSRAPTPAGLSQMDLSGQQQSLNHSPWNQPLSALPAPGTPCQAGPLPPLPPQFVPLNISIPEPGLLELEDARRTIANMPIEKLLQQDEDNDTYVTLQ
ncbi:POU domain class 2-associating factor 1 [Rhinoraja longicauda]